MLSPILLELLENTGTPFFSHTQAVSKLLRQNALRVSLQKSAILRRARVGHYHDTQNHLVSTECIHEAVHPFLQLKTQNCKQRR